MIPAIFALWFAVETHQVEPVCFASDVQRVCCPGACAARDGKEWPRANEILRGCMRGIGCKSGVDSATVFMKCKCQPKGGAS